MPFPAYILVTFNYAIVLKLPFSRVYSGDLNMQQFWRYLRELHNLLLFNEYDDEQFFMWWMNSFLCFSLTSSHLYRAPDLTNWFNMEDLDMKWEEMSWLDLKDLFLPLKKANQISWNNNGNDWWKYTNKIKCIKYKKQRKPLIWKNAALWFFSPKLDQNWILFLQLSTDITVMVICWNGFYRSDFVLVIICEHTYLNLWQLQNLQVELRSHATNEVHL